MASISSLSFITSTQPRASLSSPRSLDSNLFGLRFPTNTVPHSITLKPCSSMVVQCMSSSPTDVPPVSETKLNFLKAYSRPIPSIYNTVLQELIVQQHLMRYKKTYCYDAVFALGFVTVYDKLMEGYTSSEDREAIFKAYIQALKEDPEQYRNDAQKMEEWARTQTSTSLIEFSSREGEVEGLLKDIAERAGGKGSFSYSRFFAIGLFRLLELANATEPSVLEKVGSLASSLAHINCSYLFYQICQRSFNKKQHQILLFLLSEF